jgi:hypothetical protein
MKIIRLILVVVLALTLSVPTPASAGHRRRSYCSPSGDYCIRTFKRDGRRKFEIRMAARYFRRYKLCVIAPGSAKTCKRFRIKRQGSFYGDTVRWSTNFPNEGRGAYTVVWKMTSGGRFGKKLGFHVR